MDLGAPCAIATIVSILVAALKILTVILTFVTALVRLVGTVRSRRSRRRHGRERVHLQARALGDDEWLSKMLEESGSSVQIREREAGTESPAGRTWR